mmetsp:Transcript_86313/g.268146  ORF Transcript_86313/g.268146 Transcript_86313/m.268146 type:complete len:174 (+) Transcript_86313:192-713(+)
MDDNGYPPARLTAQALRMFLNNEIEQLRRALAGAMDLLVPGGRCVVITFKWRERTAVKEFLRDHEDPPPWAVGAVSDSRLCELYPLVATDLDYAVRQLSDAIRPSGREIEANRRSRSSSIIVLEKVSRRTPRVSSSVAPRALGERFMEPVPPPFVGGAEGAAVEGSETGLGGP